MRKLQLEDTELMRIAIQQVIRWSEKSHYDRRRPGLLLVPEHQSRRPVPELLGECRTTAQLDLAGLEARPALGNSQSLFPDTRRSPDRGRRSLRSVALAEQSAAGATMGHLRRCVDHGTAAVLRKLLACDIASADEAHRLHGPWQRRVSHSSGVAPKAKDPNRIGIVESLGGKRMRKP